MRINVMEMPQFQQPVVGNVYPIAGGYGRRVLEACGTTEAIEAVAASLSGTPSPIPGDTPK